MLVCVLQAGTQAQRCKTRLPKGWKMPDSSFPTKISDYFNLGKEVDDSWMPHRDLPMNLSCGHGHSYLQGSHSESSSLPAALYILHMILSVKFSLGWISLTHKSQATYQNRSENSLAYKNHTSTWEKETNFANIDTICWQRCGWWQSFSFKGHLLIQVYKASLYYGSFTHPLEK